MMRYLTVFPGTQLAVLTTVAAVLCWTAFSTSAMVSHAMDGHTAESRLEAMEEAYEARLAAYATQQRALEEQLNQANQRRDEVTLRLSDKQARLIETANDLQAAQAELTVVRKEFETLLDARRADAEHMAALDAELAGIRTALTETETVNGNLEGTLTALTAAMDRVVAERDSAAESHAEFDGEIRRLRAEIGQLEGREERLLSQLEGAARTSFAGLETLFSRSAIDFDRILAEAQRDYGGTGGPFEPMEDHDGTSSGTLEGDARVAALMNDLETVNLMRFAAERLPFGVPVQGGRLTSGFGPRRDRKGRGRSMHNGLDIAAPRGTPVYATADGVVTFSGRQRGYGIVVKIRHAFGFETFYAHNSRARV